MTAGALPPWRAGLRRWRGRTTHTVVRTAGYPLLRRAPLRDVVLFESWQGTQYSDSPRAISEELHRRGAPLRHVWVVGDPADAPPWAEPVGPGSSRYLAAMGRARFVVTNNTLPGYFHKKRGATYLQTWHGTPLKRIGFDLRNLPSSGGNKSFDSLRRDVATWDALLSQNRFSTEVLRKAFEFGGEIHETGYPHNDVLRRPEGEAVRRELRQRLGIADGVRAVLYAPTWRDTPTFSTELRFDALADALGDDHALLLRAHPLVASTVDLTGTPRVRDVSHHPDVRDLYLAADVLVTDYSSAMFDFAVTRKPMLFFTYDLESYSTDLRGFYFDFEASAPGPLLRTTEELVDALRDVDAVRSDYGAAYDAFVERFCHHDDGGASRRIVDRVFAGIA